MNADARAKVMNLWCPRCKYSKPGRLSDCPLHQQMAFGNKPEAEPMLDTVCGTGKCTQYYPDPKKMK